MWTRNIFLIVICLIFSSLLIKQRVWTKFQEAIKIEKLKNCVPFGKPCQMSRYSCCKFNRSNNKLESNLTPITCFRFGEGICEFTKNIQNFDEYKRLVRQLNSTNFQELRNKYWTSIAPVTQRSLAGSRSLGRSSKLQKCIPLGEPCLMSKYSCCKRNYQNESMRDGLVPATCFKFGKGICKATHNINHFDEYKRLALQLNSTNFEELKKKYWAFVAPMTLRSSVNSSSIKKLAKNICLPLGTPCLMSKYRCCMRSHQNNSKGNTLVPATCFKFGMGICETTRSISNFGEYKRLVQELNSTNFKELRKKYWASVRQSTFEVKHL